mgnify:CR=1 FL=1
MAGKKDKTVVGVIGLGIMGSAISTNLQLSGFHVLGAEVSAATRKRMSKHVAEVFSDPTTWVGRTRLLITSLPSSAALMHVAQQLVDVHRKAGVKNAKLVLANSRVTSMNKFANAFLQCKPGSEAFLYVHHHVREHEDVPARQQGQGVDAHYLGFFECFNRALFYEAHDVLEELWLGQRNGPNYAFYKGLIQLAGAFVHLQKHSVRYPRLRPAAALFTLAEENFRPYPATHERLDLAHVRTLITDWRGRLQAASFTRNPLTPDNAPKLALEKDGAR